MLVAMRRGGDDCWSTDVAAFTSVRTILRDMLTEMSPEPLLMSYRQHLSELQ